MRGGAGSKIRGIGPGDKVSYTLQFCASIDDGSHPRGTTAVGPH